MKLPIIPQDKANHFIYGLAIGLVAAIACGLAGHPKIGPVASALVACIAGGLKEWVDSMANSKSIDAGLPPQHGVEGEDWLVTTLGGLFIGVVLLVQRI